MSMAAELLLFGEITEILVISWLPDPPLGAREELGYPLSEVVLG